MLKQPTRLELPERPRILVITLRRLGDVLLTAPLLRSIRRGFGDATLDVPTLSLPCRVGESPSTNSFHNRQGSRPRNSG